MLSHIIIVHFNLFFEGASKHIYLDLYCSSFQKRDISSQKKRLNIRTHCNSICHTDASSRSEIERVTYTRFGTKRERSAILNSKYALHVTSALVSQKICCLQAHDGVFTRRVQIHRRTYMHVHICMQKAGGASRFPRVSLGVPPKRRRPIEMQTSGILCVLSSSTLWSATYPATTSKTITIHALSNSNVRLTTMGNRRISGYSFKNYSYSPCAFKQFEGNLSMMFPHDIFCEVYVNRISIVRYPSDETI